MDFLNGYKRTPTQFEWCGTTVWLVKLTQADHEAIWQTDTTPATDEAADKTRVRNFYVDILARSLVNQQGEFIANTDAAGERFRTHVAFDDLKDLGLLSMKHSGYPVKDEEQQKKS